MQFIELFAGAGGMGLGLHAAGMGHELSIEKEAAPHSVLLNAGKAAVRMDLRDVGGFCNRLRHRPDLIAGGPPCQDFSKAGKRKIGERAFLTQHFAQIICLTRPEWFIFENVEGAPRSQQYQYARSLWKRHGYGLTELVMDAQSYGVPQRRKRFFCIGRLDEVDQFLLDGLEAAASKKPMVVRDMLNPRLYPEDADLLEKGAFFARPWMGKRDEPNGRGVISIDECCPTIARNTREHPGETYIEHPKDSAKLRDTHILTLDQVARIQGFPPAYDFKKKKKKHARGPDSGWTEKQIQLMIANAVPAPMAHAIGKAIYERHYGFSIPKLDKALTPWLQESSRKRSPKGKAMSISAANNIRSHVRKAREMVGCRMYANLALEVQALEASSEIIWIDRKTRRREVGKRYIDMSIRQRSDLRTALELYHAYMSETREPSKWAPPKPKKVVVPDFKNPPKPSKGRREASVVSDSESFVRVSQLISWPAPYKGSQTDPELAHLESLLVEDFEPPHDPFEPSPPRDDDGYPDYDPEADYEEELQERLRMSEADD